MVGKYYYFKKGECPVCGGGGSDRCSRAEDSGLHFCKVGGNNRDFVFIKTSTIGFGIYQHISQIKSYSEEQSAEYLRQRERKAREREREVQIFLKKQLSEEERDSQLKALISQLNLKATHLDHLVNRGLSQATIETWGFVTLQNNFLQPRLAGGLAGVSPDGLSVVGKPGILCPIRNVEGQLIGYQIKTDSGDAKYVWATTDYNGQKAFSSKLQNGELPINVVRGNNTERIGLCEGVLKHVVASEIHGYTFIGAAGGNLSGSPQQLKSALEQLLAENPEAKITLYPDSNAVQNKNVHLQNQRTLALLISWGYSVEVANWGQLWDKCPPDCDEILADTYFRYIPAEKYFGLKPDAGWLDFVINLASKISRKKARKLQIEDLGFTSQIYLPGSLPWRRDVSEGLPTFIFSEGLAGRFYTEAVQKGWQYLFDQSQTGSGKTHTVGTLEATQFFAEEDDKLHRLIYLTKDARNPNTVALERDFEELPARNSGFFEDPTRPTPLGRPHRSHPKLGQPVRGEGNCHLTAEHRIYNEKRLDGSEICEKCPFFADCSKGEGDGFGFKFQMLEALQSSKIRGNIKGLSPDMVDQRTVLVVDEFSQSLEPVELISVSVAEFNATFTRIENQDPDLYLKLQKTVKLPIGRLFGNIDVKKYPFGLDRLALAEHLSEPVENLDFVLERLADLEAEKSEIENKFIAAGISPDIISSLTEKRWLPTLLRVLAGVERGSLHLNQAELQIAIKNERQAETLKSAKAAIFQDATGSLAELALILDCEASEILVCRQEDREFSNLQITQVLGFGLANKHRGKQTDERLTLLAEKLREKHGAEAIGFIDWKNKAGEGYLHHFS